MNLRHSVSAGGEVDLVALLDELRIVMAPSLDEENIAAQWTVDPALPLVWADRSSLMQVFLNVITNSNPRPFQTGGSRALHRRPGRGSRVLVEFTDTGGGWRIPSIFFAPSRRERTHPGWPVSVPRFSPLLRRGNSLSTGTRRRLLHREPQPGGFARAGFPMTETRIMMVDDHGLFRESLGRLLESTPEFCIVARSATAAEALDALARIEADIVLLDYDLGDETALPLLSEIRRRWSALRILMVTAGLSDENTLHVMEAGASGVFLKHNSPDRLVSAIRKVTSGEVWLDDSSFRSLLAGKRNRTEMLGRAQPLTARQSEGSARHS